MTTEQLSLILYSAMQDADLLLEELPNIDLYMDQILALFEEKLGTNRKDSSEKLLTKTMINNYSKEKLIQPSKGKKYSKEQLIYLLMVYSAKNTLSISEIKTLFQWIRSDPALGQRELEDCYTYFLVNKEIMRTELPLHVLNLLKSDDTDLTVKQQQLIAALSISAMSSYLKQMAENLIESLQEPS